MCAGAAAVHQQNKAAARQYGYQLKVQERENLQKHSLYKTQVAQFNRKIGAIDMGLAASYSRAQHQLNREKDAIAQENQETLIDFFQNSKYGDLMASGQTGRSIRRIGQMELGALGRFYADQGSKLTDAREDYMAGVRSARGRATADKEDAYTKIWLPPVRDVTPPKPVMGSVGAAFAGDVLGAVGTVASVAAATSDGNSERIIKENIKKIGEAISGLGIYKFNYIDDPTKTTYIGGMVDEIEKVFPEAISEGEQGLTVNYNLTDITFKVA